MTMPPSWFNVLYEIAVEKQNSKQAEDIAKADAIEEIAEEGGL